MTDLFVSLDLEMTGVDLESDEIIEIGAIKFTREGELERFHTLVNPGRVLPRRIESLTGILAGELKTAPPFAEVRDRFVEFVGDAPVVGQRIDWDLGFLGKHGLSAGGPVLDVAELAELLLPGVPDYGLRAMAARLEVPFPVQHRAIPDAETAMAVFQRLVDLAAALNPQVLQEIVVLTADSPWPMRHVFRLAAEEAVRAGRLLAEQPIAETPAQSRSPGVSLVPNQRRVPVAPEEVPAILDAAAADAERFPAFEHRPEQARMAE